MNGQDGWLKTGAFDSAVFANGADQQPFGFGGQSLRISNAVSSGTFGDQTFSADLGDEAGETGAVSHGQGGGVRQKKFDARFRFSAFDFDTAPAADAIVNVAPDHGDGDRMSNVRIIDRADGSGLDVLAYNLIDNGENIASTFDQVTVAENLSRGTAHSLRIEIEYVDGEDNDVVKVYVDGDSTADFTGKSWEQYYRHDPEQAAGGKRVPTTDGLLFRINTGAEAGNAGQGILLDDLRLESSGNPTGPQGPQGDPGTPGGQGIRPAGRSRRHRRHGRHRPARGPGPPGHPGHLGPDALLDHDHRQGGGHLEVAQGQQEAQGVGQRDLPARQRPVRGPADHPQGRQGHRPPVVPGPWWPLRQR